MRKNILYFLLFIVITAPLFSKSYYPDGNYSETLGCSRMCMRCHMDILNPPGTSLSIKSTANKVKAGDTIEITVNISNFSSKWNPGIGITTDNFAQYASHFPQDIGWQIISNSNSNEFNYIKSQSGAKEFKWKLIAPQIPGIYRFATSAYFAADSSGKIMKGTKRGDNSIAVEVTKSQTTDKPVSLSVSAKFKNFVFLEFSKPIDSVSAVNKGNYSVINNSTSGLVSINKIFCSRDGKTITLITDNLKANQSYKINIVDLKDYSIQPNIFSSITKDFSVDSASPYKIYAEWSSDVTQTRIGDGDMTEYVGLIDDEVSRTILAFALPDSPIDMLPVSDFISAKLYVRQKAAPAFTSIARQWDVHKLLPDSNWWDYVGNKQSVEDNWSGYNQQNPPIASINKKVDQNSEIWWI